MRTILLRFGALFLGLALLLLALPSAAQQTLLDAERFKPAITHDSFVTVEGSNVRPTQDRWEFGLALNYARNTLVTVNGAGDVTNRFISGRLGFDAYASVTIWKPFALGLDIPFFLAQTGDVDPDFAGLGDIRLLPKIRFIDNSDRGFGLALVTELRAPTHVGDFAGGSRMVVFAPRLIADYRSLESFHAAINVGATIREETQFLNIRAGHEFAYGAALGYRFGGRNGPVELGADLLGGIGLVETGREEIPLEVFPYVKFFPGHEWEIMAGPGIGLAPGYGIPIVRAFAGVRYSPTSHDKDHDGIPDDVDRCPDEPENRNGIEDADGCPDEDGDDDGDGVPNSKDQCPGQKESINGFQDEDGCPDGGPAKVIREDGQFRVLEAVRFKSGSAQIEPESYNILNQVALMLKANPDIKKMRIEGHTDEVGSHEMNVELSKSRAKAVRDYLVARGVRSGRLRSEGYGPDKPVVRGTDAAARAKNRRVEFIIE